MLFWDLRLTHKKVRDGTKVDPTHAVKKFPIGQVMEGTWK